jgi:SAM-dependent methyltransferase
MNYDNIRSQVQQYYDAKLQSHGPTARGVDWNSPESQQLRFDQLLKIVDRNSSFTINDFGCGYGALVDYLVKEGCSFQYYGFDISKEMVAQANELHVGMSNVVFLNREADLSQADYTIASGIFNVKLNTPVPDWENYILETMTFLNGLSRRGFSFNVLTKYSQQEFMRPDLYYADPLMLFDYCKTRFSRFVSILHDYPLYEFTILVRKTVE